MTTMSGQYVEGVGRRKTAVARVRLYRGSGGTIIVNDRPLEQYFTRASDVHQILGPLQATGMVGAFNATIQVIGGGVSGQAGAVCHGMARALVRADETLKQALRKGGFLTRDPRIKERKKPGLKRARKAKQYTKR